MGLQEFMRLPADGYNLLVLVYAGWRIAEPQKFHSSFPGGIDDAKRSLESLVRSAKNAAVGITTFVSHLMGQRFLDAFARRARAFCASSCCRAR